MANWIMKRKKQTNKSISTLLLLHGSTMNDNESNRPYANLTTFCLYSYTYEVQIDPSKCIPHFGSVQFSIPVRCSLLARTPVILHLIWCIHIYSHMNSYVFSPYRLVNSESICKYNIMNNKCCSIYSELGARTSENASPPNTFQFGRGAKEVRCKNGP